LGRIIYFISVADIQELLDYSVLLLSSLVELKGAKITLLEVIFFSSALIVELNCCSAKGSVGRGTSGSN